MKWVQLPPIPITRYYSYLLSCRSRFWKSAPFFLFFLQKDLTREKKYDKMAGRVRLPRPEFPLYHMLSFLSSDFLKKIFFVQNHEILAQFLCNLYKIFVKKFFIVQCVEIFYFILCKLTIAFHEWVCYNVFTR